VSGDDLNLDWLDEQAAAGRWARPDETTALIAEVRRLRNLADEIEGGEWGDLWRGINVHGAIRNYKGVSS